MTKIPKPPKRDQVISVKVTAATKHKLDTFAAQQGLPLSLIVQLWVQEKLRNMEEGYSVADDLFFPR